MALTPKEVRKPKPKVAKPTMSQQKQLDAALDRALRGSAKQSNAEALRETAGSANRESFLKGVYKKLDRDTPRITPERKFKPVRTFEPVRGGVGGRSKLGLPRAFIPEASRSFRKPENKPSVSKPTTAPESPTMRSNPRKLTPDFSRVSNPNAREFKPTRVFEPVRGFSANPARNAGYAAREAAERQAARGVAGRAAASTAGRALLGRAASLTLGSAALPATAAYIVGDALKDTKPALAARDKVAGFFSRSREYKQEQKEKADLEAARKRGEAKRDAGKSDYMKQVSDSALKNYQDKQKQEAPQQEVQIGTASVPKAARPDPVKSVPQATRTVSTPAPASKPRNYSTEAADRLKESGLGEDNAVVGRLRERAKMTQEERDKPFGEDNAVLKELRAKGYDFAKGGKINGRAVKGKTKGRYI